MSVADASGPSLGDKRPAEGPPASSGDILKITPLGAGNEVGRSCIIIEYKNKTIMVREGTLSTCPGA